MAKYKCSICGYIYDEAVGIPDEGIAPGTLWVPPLLQAAGFLILQQVGDIITP